MESVIGKQLPACMLPALIGYPKAQMNNESCALYWIHCSVVARVRKRGYRR